MTGIGLAVGKTIAKSGMPPLQKAGIVVVSGFVAGLGHSFISTANRDAVRVENKTSISSAVNSHIKKFIDDSNVSPMQELLYNVEIMCYLCLSLIYLLIIQLVFKLYFKDSINLNLSKLLGNKINNKLEFYLNKIIKLNKQMSVIWILFGIIIIVFGLSTEGYALYKLFINLDSFVQGYISFNPKFSDNIRYIPKKSLKDILLYLNITNFISIILLISLLILTVALALAAYTFGGLYTHIGSYVSMYIK